MNHNYHIAINAVGIKHSGGATVLQDFLKAAAIHEDIAQITVFCSPRPQRQFDFLDSPKIIIRNCFYVEESYLYRVVWGRFGLPHQCEKMGIDALFCMVGWGHSGKKIPKVILIQQSLPFSQEYYKIAGFYERLYVKTLRVLMSHSTQSANRIIVQTPTMKSWVSHAFKHPESKISVVVPSSTPIVENLEVLKSKRLDISDDYNLLYVGSQANYKNVNTLIEAMDIIQQEIPQATLFLTWPSEHKVNEKPGIVCLDYLSGAALWQAYINATIVVMPSLIETVGFSMLEAMSLGKPVLAADRPYAHDICQDAAIFFDPLSITELAQVTIWLLKNRSMQEKLSAFGLKISRELHKRDPYRQMVDIVIQEVQ